MDSAFDWPDGYQLVLGSTLDRAQLIAMMGRAYKELGATQLGHLTKTVELYLANLSTLWWLQKPSTTRVGFTTAKQEPPIGCLWLGQSINQLTGASQAYVYLVYVDPSYRRQGLGRKLMNHAQYWAKAQGYEQIGLQVFANNLSALRLYESQGYQTQAIWMTRNLENGQ